LRNKQIEIKFEINFFEFVLIRIFYLIFSLWYWYF